MTKSDIYKIKLKSILNGYTTPAYIAPEILYQNLSTKKVDMWALGVILYQFFANKLPFEEVNNHDTMISIK